jgi:hypothetical protein
MQHRHHQEVAAKLALSAGAAAFNWGHHYDKSWRNDLSMTGQAFMDEFLDKGGFISSTPACFCFCIFDIRICHSWVCMHSDAAQNLDVC